MPSYNISSHFFFYFEFFCFLPKKQFFIKNKKKTSSVLINKKARNSGKSINVWLSKAMNGLLQIVFLFIKKNFSFFFFAFEFLVGFFFKFINFFSVIIVCIYFYIHIDIRHIASKNIQIVILRTWTKQTYIQFSIHGLIMCI